MSTYFVGPNSPSPNTGFSESGDVFFLTGNGSSMELSNTSNSPIFLQGPNEHLQLITGFPAPSQTGNDTIFDEGKNSTLGFFTIGTNAPPTSVFGFNASDHLNFYEGRSLTPPDTTVRSDGHGGTMVGAVDLIGFTHLQASQITHSP